MRSMASLAHTGCGGSSPLSTPPGSRCLAAGARRPARLPGRAIRRGTGGRGCARCTHGQREPRAMSSTLLRSVSSPRPSTIALAAAAVHEGLGGGLEAGADQRPGGTEGQRGGHAAPVGDPARGQHRHRRRQVDHDRHERQRGPAVPGAVAAASVPCATMTSAPRSSACRASSRLGDLDDQRRAGRADRAGERARVAEGQHHRGRPGLPSASSTVASVDRPALEADAPGAARAAGHRPAARGPASSGSRCRRRAARGRRRWMTAAASAPPADPPIGASAIGCRSPSSSVNAVRSAMAAPSVGRRPGHRKPWARQTAAAAGCSGTSCGV